MYRCHHCRDLHLLAEQAKRCSRTGSSWYADAVGEIDRILDRGPIPVIPAAVQAESPHPGALSVLFAALEAALPGAARAGWSLPGIDRPLPIFVPAAALAIDLGPATTAADRLWSCGLRSQGVSVLRVPDSLVATVPERVVAAVDARIRASGSSELLSLPGAARAI